MIAFHRILCPIDFSDHSKLALRYAVSMATEYGSQLVVLHSLPEPLPLVGFPSTIPPVQYDLREAKERMESLTERYIPPNVSFIERSYVGAPTKMILDTVEKDDCDLIVMGTHGLSGMEAFLIGSVTYKVLHKANVPVMVVCNTERDFFTEDPNRPIEIKNVLCAVSPDARTEKMVGLALTFAKQYGARLLFYQVQNPADLGDFAGLGLQQVKQMITSEDEDWCRIEYGKEPGDPAEQILGKAQAYNADIIFMGHHTRRPLALNILGSVALKVVREAPCPVMVIRE